MGSLDSLINSFQGVGQAGKTASEGVQAAAKSTNAAQKSAELLTRATQRYVSALGRMEGELKSISSGLGDLVAGFKNLENALIAAFGGYALQAAGEYNKQLYDLSRTAKTMGASFGAVTKSLDDMGKSTRLSRDEAATFFAAVRDGTAGIRLSADEISDLARTISAEFGPSLKDMTEAFRDLAAVQKEDIFLFQRLNKNMSPKTMQAYVATMVAAGKVTREQAQSLTRLQVRQTLYGSEVSASEKKQRAYVDTLQELKSTFQDLIISIGQPLVDVFQNIIPPITKVIDKIRMLVDQSSAISSLIGGVAKVGAFMAIAGTVAASLASTTGMLMKIVPMVSSVTSQMAGGLGKIANVATGGMAGKAGGAMAGVPVVGSLLGGFGTALATTTAVLAPLGLALGGVVAAVGVLGTDMEGLAETLDLPKEMARDLGETFGGLRDDLQASFQEVTDMFKAALPDLLKMLAGFGRIVADLVKAILPPFKQILGIIIRELLPVFTQYWEALVKLVGELLKVFVKLLVPVVKLGAVIADKVIPVVSSAVEALTGFIDALGETIDTMLGWIGLGPSEAEMRAREAERQRRIEQNRQERQRSAFETRFEESLGGGEWKRLLGTDEDVTRGQLEDMFSIVQGSFGGKEFIDALRTEGREVKDTLGTIASLQREGVDFSDKQQYALTAIQRHVAKSVATEAAIEKGLTGDQRAEYITKQVKMIMGGQAAMSEIAGDYAKALINKNVLGGATAAIGEQKITQQVGAVGILDDAALAAQQSAIGVISERMSYLLNLNQQMEGAISKATGALEEQANIVLKYQFDVDAANSLYAKIQDKLRVQLRYQRDIRDTVMDQADVLIEQGRREYESAQTAEERASAQRIIQEGLATQEEFMAKMAKTQSMIVDQNIKRVQSEQKIIELIDSEVGVLESQLKLVDSLYGGIGPRIGLQAQLLGKYQEQADAAAKMEKAFRQLAEEQPKQLIYQKLANEQEQKRVQYIQKQVDLAKGLRDQYVDAITALTQVEGKFQKFVITREQGFGKALTEFGLKGGFTTGGIGAGMQGPAYQFAAGGGISAQHPFQMMQFWQQAFEQAGYAPGGVLPGFGGVMKQTPGGAEAMPGVGLGRQGPGGKANMAQFGPFPTAMSMFPISAMTAQKTGTTPQEAAREQAKKQADIRAAGGAEAMWLEKIYYLLEQGVPVGEAKGPAQGKQKRLQEEQQKSAKQMARASEKINSAADTMKNTVTADTKTFMEKRADEVATVMKSMSSLGQMEAAGGLPTGGAAFAGLGGGKTKAAPAGVAAAASPGGGAEAQIAALKQSGYVPWPKGISDPRDPWYKKMQKSAITAGGKKWVPRSIFGGNMPVFGEQRGKVVAMPGASASEGQFIFGGGRGLQQKDGEWEKMGIDTSGMASGGMRHWGMASGGPVPGSGSGDTVPAWLAPGEFVMRRDAVSTYGMSFMDALNAKKFRTGGPVERGGGGGAMYSVNFNIKADNAGDILSKVNIKLSEVLNDTFGGNTSPHRFEQSQDLI